LEEVHRKEGKEVSECFLEKKDRQEFLLRIIPAVFSECSQIQNQGLRVMVGSP
jgi:hypothetical protein